MLQRRVIYIAGLGHSGSTVLDMLLATTKKAVSLGQIWTVLREDTLKSRTRVCSCGALAPDCDFWGPIIHRINGSMSEGERYKFVLERVEDLYGPEMAVVDSSKHVANIATLVNEVRGLSLVVLHNIKDVRAFTVSMLDNSTRKHTRRSMPERLFFEWYRTNRMIQSQTSQTLGRPPLRIMYEALCFCTQDVAERLKDLLGEQYIDPSAGLKSGTNHIISGNRLRLFESEEAVALNYDWRWFE